MNPDKLNMDAVRMVAQRGTDLPRKEEMRARPTGMRTMAYQIGNLGVFEWALRWGVGGRDLPDHAYGGSEDV
jgi:hypothetical protein